MMRIRVILVRIRIRILVSVPLTNGSGCGSRRAQNIRIRIRMGNKFGLFCNMPMQYGNSLIVYHTLPLGQLDLHCFHAYPDPDLTFQYQGCESGTVSGSGLDPDSIGSVDPNPDSESGSRTMRAKMSHKSRFFYINSYFDFLDELF
jgi:hypothetical protein